MSKFLRAATIWLWGGFIYYCVELSWRGFSHPTMYVIGGLCFLIVGGVNNYLPWEMGFVWQSVIAAVAVTAVELVSGLIINRWIGLEVWDYSNIPYNVLGQICLPYFFAWIALSAVGIYLDDYLRWRLFDEDRPRYTMI